MYSEPLDLETNKYNGKPYVIFIAVFIWVIICVVAVTNLIMYLISEI
jgi:hypothetical protein